jgi:hypothetical protein
MALRIGAPLLVAGLALAAAYDPADPANFEPLAVRAAR